MNNETAQVRILAIYFIFFIYLFFFWGGSFCLCMCGNVTKNLFIFCI